ncbi:UNVERIFIED_CONTAM: hypothetical protein FKN15_040209 [Acipenser sinensis]
MPQLEIVLLLTNHYYQVCVLVVVDLSLAHYRRKHLALLPVQTGKVIYALNTKNDEHEAAIQTLKEAHEEEVQQILSETREKILQYKSKVSDEVDLRRRIQSLEESMELHERMKRQAMAEFKTYRHRVEDMQLCSEAQHTQHVVTMSREVEEMRRSFEEKLRSFTQVQAQFEMEKRLALEELRSAHRQEIQELLRGHQSQNANYSKDQEKLEQLHKTEVDSLTEHVEELKMDKKKLGLQKQLDEATQNTGILIIEQKEMECELEATRDRVQQQATEILLKASHIGSLQAMQMTHEAAIRDLESEKSRLNNKLARLEEERGLLQSKSQSMDESQKQQIQALEKALKEEKQSYEKEMVNIRAKYEEEAAQFKETQAKVLEELSNQHQATVETTQTTGEREKKMLQMEKELLGRISELQEEVRHRENQITELDEEIHSLHENISTLTKELEYKGKEVLKIRSEANQQIRVHEQELNKKHEKEVNEMTMVHVRETQNMLLDFNKAQELLKDKITALQILVHEQELNKKHEKEVNEMTMVHVRETQNMLLDFNKAQELLKDKITALQILLEGAEEKFRNRESRPEDLQFIAELKDMVTERESLVKKLIQKKKNDKSANRFTSAPNLSALEPTGTGHGPPQPTRLEPIPNSPIHDLEFNSSKPLPQPTPPKEPKKFLR